MASMSGNATITCAALYGVPLQLMIPNDSRQHIGARLAISGRRQDVLLRLIESPCFDLATPVIATK